MSSVEHVSRNCWRLNVTIDTSAGRLPFRTTIRMDPALPEAVQRRDAERELRNLERRLAAEQASTWTLSDWSAEWLAKHVEPDCSPVTVANYRHLLQARILPALGDYPLQDLTPAVLTDWLLAVRGSPRRTTAKADADLARPRAPSDRRVPADRTARPLSANTVLHYYTCMEAMLAAAVRMGYLEHNPMDRVQRPKLHKHRPPAFSEADALRLIAALNDHPNIYFRLAVHLALICGLRLGEVVALRWADLDWDARTLNISRALKYTPATGSYVDTPKTDAGQRLVTLPESMMRLITEAGYQDSIDELDAGDAWHGSGCLVHNKAGAQLHHDTPSKWFRAFADAHGFQGLRFHDLRHAHASLLLAHNIDVVSVSARMGHTNPSVTLSVYAHALPARDHDAAAYFEQLLAPPSDPCAGSAPPPDAGGS